MRFRYERTTNYYRIDMSKVLELMSLVEELHEFASLQITLPEEVNNIIQSVRSQIPGDQIYWEEDLGHSYEAHTTIFWGLSSLDDVVPIARHLHGKGPFPLIIGNSVSAFTSSKENDVLYFPVLREELSQIHYELRHILHKDPPTFREYTPHVTIAYVKKGYDPAPLVVPFEKLVCFVDTLDFRAEDETSIKISLME